ncbi:MAG: Zn-dependent hydrolase of the beta-lactamase fold-like protein [Frankiales bacterium]|nr:Zn-dependent hydrolase of the beta-lactamase fold-like protein [Frankiales bacterium]
MSRPELHVIGHSTVRIDLGRLHGDHLRLPSRRQLGTGTRIVVPRGAGRWLGSHGFRQVDELAAGESLTDGGLRITAVPALHSGHRWGPRLTHDPDCPAVGHLVEGDRRSVYAAGAVSWCTRVRSRRPARWSAPSSCTGSCAAGSPTSGTPSRRARAPRWAPTARPER